MRAIFARFDNFLTMFVALFGVLWSTMFMPLLGGPMHPYEARAIGAGWQSLQSGQATSINEAFEIATSLPVEAVFPSAHAAEAPFLQAPVQISDPLELLGGPEIDTDPARLEPARLVRLSVVAQAPPISLDALADAVPAMICDVPAMKQGLCDPPQAAGDAIQVGA